MEDQTACLKARLDAVDGKVERVLDVVIATQNNLLARVEGLCAWKDEHESASRELLSMTDDIKDMREKLTDLLVWKQDHDNSGRELLAMTADLRHLVAAKHWANATHRVALWVIGIIVAFSTAWVWVKALLGGPRP